ncbi:T9SS type A sorting domain-containing protein [Flavobacterium urocaniciphilum]|uniref:Por secretion system C-terminal sorting domain-containing protein n=1 Tax=Flavobacterium urocaniciphilum TaxID=1299341 RepID=A0A1H9ATB9_9FLAO|nr:T9SS type A sorting domain-containing protein [Flavobacterium urocaniciphilum]SEP79960.1 Por secretion system C-terminal sorting domain-containing protein [Flavobacterium urocaniciphilum]
MKKHYLFFLLTALLGFSQQPTLVKDVTSTLNPNALSTSQIPWNNCVWNGKAFYSGSGSNRLVVTDGTNAGTVGISNLGGETISKIIPAQDFVYVITSVTTFTPSISATDKIWKTDGTPAGTVLVKTLGTTSLSEINIYYSVEGHKKNYSLDGNVLYFSAKDATNGVEIWRTDGTTIGTYIVKDIMTGISGSAPAGFCKIGSDVIFKASSVGNPGKLWKTDGTDIGTSQIPVTEPFYIVNSDMVKLGNKVVFFAHNTVDGYEPYVSDGTASGTFMLKNINPGGNSLPTQAQGLHLKVVGNYCFFIANDGVDFGLWRTDGTTAGTIKLNSENNNISDSAYSAVDNEKLWYINYNFSGSGANSKLIVTDGTIEGTSVVHSTLSYPQNLKVYKGSVWMQSRDLGSPANAEVWRSDGLQVNTNLAFDVGNGAFSSNPNGFFELNGKLYFFGEYNSNNNFGLFQFNGDFTFNGSVNSDWNNKNNWNSTLVPNSSDNVTIPSGYSISTSASAYARNISVASPINLNVGNLNIYGTASLNNSAKITLNNNSLILKGKTASATGDLTSYIVTNGTGKVSVENVDVARGIVNLPIGTSTTFNPVLLTNSGVNDTFSARVETGISSTYSGEIPGSLLTNNAVNATWFINEATAGGSNVSLGLQWNTSQELSGFDRNNAKMGHFNGVLWDGFSGALSGTDPYTYLVNGISTFSPFSIQNNSVLSEEEFNVTTSFIKLFPNPSNGEFSINISEDLRGSNVSIYNLIGQKVMSFEMNDLITNTNLNSGIYIISIIKEGKKFTEKIIIK